MARALTQVRAARGAFPDTSAAPLLVALAARPANTVYAADLLETRAYVLRAAGQAVRARAELLTRAEAAATPEVAGRRYRTLAQWALAENQPAQAADWLFTATAKGDQAAFRYRPLALARAGRLDSARGALPVLLGADDPALQAAGRYLAAVLTAPARFIPTDSARTDWLVLRGNNAPAETVDSVLARIQAPAVQAIAIASLADNALNQGDFRRASELLARLPADQPLTARAAPTLRWLRAETALHTGHLPEAQRLLSGPAPTEPTLAGWQLYLTGALAAAKDDNKAALAAFIALPARAPWLSRGLLTAAAWLTQHPPKANPLAAYETLLAGVRYHRASVPLWQAYALECAHQGFTDFGQNALDNLQRLQSAPAFATFRAVYETSRQAARAADGFE